MNIQPFNVDQESAKEALRMYREHKHAYDALDPEITKIYRAIARGRKVISVNDAIVHAGLDDKGRPNLAICRADAIECRCEINWDSITFGVQSQVKNWSSNGKISIPWKGMRNHSSAKALLPRIPPQHRPLPSQLKNYHILWEADWVDVPVDPYLLRRIGKDAWVILAAWDLTAVERSVVRSHRSVQ